MLYKNHGFFFLRKTDTKAIAHLSISNAFEKKKKLWDDALKKLLNILTYL